MTNPLINYDPISDTLHLAISDEPHVVHFTNHPHVAHLISDNGGFIGFHIDAVSEFVKPHASQRKIVIEPDSTGGFNAEIPALKGCMAQGETLRDVLDSILDVERAWFEIAKERSWELPYSAPGAELVLDK